jgi:hypothetical protein
LIHIKPRQYFRANLQWHRDPRRPERFPTEVRPDGTVVGKLELRWRCRTMFEVADRADLDVFNK